MRSSAGWSAPAGERYARRSPWTRRSSEARRSSSAITSSTRRSRPSCAPWRDSSRRRRRDMAATSEITDIIKAQIRSFQGKPESADVGTVVEVGDGIARIYGLAGCMASELLDFGHGVFGLAFNLEEDTVSAIILGDYVEIKEGDEVRTTGRIAEVPVGDALVGRVVDPLGRAIDGKGPIQTKQARKIDVGAPDPATLQYIAPLAGCAMGEFFRDGGKDALIVYAGLTKHAWAYREVSLLVRRPPGREAYPGDVFYLHSRLLERAARMNDENGGGSLTALPIIETKANDISAYIPTNVISITDGQLYLETDLFNAGVRPAINTGLSVSRVGGDAQIKAMSKVTGSLKLDLGQFRELAAFAQFGSDLDQANQRQLRRGERLVEMLKQPQYQPVPVEKEIVIIFCGTAGYLDDVPKEAVQQFERDLYRYMDSVGKNVTQRILKERKWTPEIEKDVRAMIEEFKKGHPYGEKQGEPPKETAGAEAQKKAARS